MTVFEYIAVLVSIIIGLGITHLLGAVGRLIAEHRATSQALLDPSRLGRLHVPVFGHLVVVAVPASLRCLNGRFTFTCGVILNAVAYVPPLRCSFSYRVSRRLSRVLLRATQVVLWPLDNHVRRRRGRYPPQGHRLLRRPRSAVLDGYRGVCDLDQRGHDSPEARRFHGAFGVGA